jgi:hypothetical protein
VPRDVMQGYRLMAEEAADQLDAPPTHAFVPGGVGGVAAAVSVQLRARYGSDVKVVVAEPEKAACLLASAEAGEPVTVPGDLDTLMAGLACGEPSLLAWQELERGAFAFMAVQDDSAVDACGCWRAEPEGGGGESAVAGLAALLLAARDPFARGCSGSMPTAACCCSAPRARPTPRAATPKRSARRLERRRWPERFDVAHEGVGIVGAEHDHPALELEHDHPPLVGQVAAEAPEARAPEPPAGAEAADQGAQPLDAIHRRFVDLHRHQPVERLAAAPEQVAHEDGIAREDEAADGAHEIDYGQCHRNRRQHDRQPHRHIEQNAQGDEQREGGEWRQEHRRDDA